MDEALADARAVFSSFPEPIFDLWLDDRIRQSGWPPNGIDWNGYLDGRTIAYWQALNWMRTRTSVKVEELSHNSLALVGQITAAAAGVANAVSCYIPNTAERFRSCLQFIQQNATTPGTVILHRSEAGLFIVDGNHRIAALLAVQSQLSTSASPLLFDAWIATPLLERKSQARS
ncbi:MAG: hypothetical protein SF172_14950 [Burkholderiales bacterium]|nr:hypothetical protein [Burkholderiales bacterium]